MAADEAGLVGRRGELRGLDAALDRLAAGEPALLWLVGEPGIGKTALLRELGRMARDRGFVARRGRAAQLAGEVPFESLVAALDDFLAALNPRLFEPLGREALAELAAIFPSLAELADEPVGHIQSEERYRTYRAIRLLLELLGNRRPIVIAIDDLHWADLASLELVAHLVRHRPRSAVLLAVASRSGRLPEAAEAELRAAEQEGSIERLELGRLSADEAEALVSRTIADPRLRGRVVTEAAGNPFYLEQLAAHPNVVGGTGPAPAAGEVPDAIAFSLRAEVRALDPVAQRVIQGAAVAGDPFEADLAAIAAELSDDEALTALDRLIERTLVHPTDSPRRYRFRHPIVWRAVYDATPPGWRLVAHARLADALGAQGASPETRAPHVERSARPADEGAISLLETAGRAALPRAPASAARWLDAALRLLPADPVAQPRRVSLLLARASALGSTGRLADARQALRQVLELLPRDMHRQRIKAAVTCSVVEHFLSLDQEARAVLVDELEALDEHDSEGRATLSIALANLGWQSNDYDEVSLWCRRALSGADTGSVGVEVAARSLLAFQAARVGRVPESQELIGAATSRLDALPDESLAEHLQGILGLSAAELFAERTTDAIRHSERGIHIARSTGQANLLPLMMMGRAWSLTWEGRLDDARPAWEEMLEISLLTGNAEMEAWALTGSTWIAQAASEPPEAHRIAERALRAAARVRGDQARAYATLYPARVYADLGDHERARELILAAGGGPELPNVEPVWRPHNWRDLARCQLALGDREAAEVCAAMAEALARETGLEGRWGWAMMTKALVAEDRGDSARAATLALGAAESLGRGRLWLEEPVARTIAGRALAQAGDRGRAASELSRALDRARAMGAHRFADQAARELRRFGLRGARSNRAAASIAVGGRRGLSPREREVAELVAAGRTNKEIAVALFISAKTVEKHLANVFDKLGVRSRAAVGARLADH